MKIKHYAGYGAVQAKKIEKTDNYLKVRVFGNHECGIMTDDKYNVFNWLVKRFDKKHTDYFDIESIDIEYYIKYVNGIETEHCDYNIYFRD